MSESLKAATIDDAWVEEHCVFAPDCQEIMVVPAAALKKAIRARSQGDKEMVDTLKSRLDDCTYSFDGREKMQTAFDEFKKSLRINE